jgi:hypothetical protein
MFFSFYICSTTEQFSKKDIKSSSGSSEDQKSFSFYTCSTKEYYKIDIVELSYSFSTYTMNSIKKISNLPVDLWKIKNLFLLLNFHTRFLRTRHHVVSKSPPYSKSQTHITTTNNKTHKPPPTLPSNGGYSQNSSRRYSSLAHRA